MARLIAIDWDRLEARVVVARPQAGGVAIEQAFAQPIDLPAQDNAVEGLAEQLSKALATARVSKGQVLSAIGRSALELRTMSLPPAPAEELPDMVRFQAMREFSSLEESSPLDFMPLGDAAQQEGEVVAAAIPSSLANEVQRAILDQGHESKRCVMRPASAASLALRKVPQAKRGVTLIIGQQAESAELTITKHGTVVFTRSFRLPANWHPGESGRTAAGGSSPHGGRGTKPIGRLEGEHIILFGSASEHAGLQQRLAERTKLTVDMIDPFDDLVVGGSMPESRERYAALVGMLQDESEEVAPSLDFLNPRKRPEPESNRRQYTLYTMTAATVALAAIFLWWWQHNKLNDQIAQAQWKITQTKEENRKLKYAVNMARELKAWKKADKNWLDELMHLSSTDGLSADDFRIELVNGKTLPDGRGSIMLRGRAKDNEARQRFQNKMEDKNHKVVPGRVELDEKQDERYPILFNTTILTDKYIDILAAAPPPSASATPTPESEAPVEPEAAETSDKSANTSTNSEKEDA